MEGTVRIPSSPCSQGHCCRHFSIVVACSGAGMRCWRQVAGALKELGTGPGLGAGSRCRAGAASARGGTELAHGRSCPGVRPSPRSIKLALCQQARMPGNFCLPIPALSALHPSCHPGSSASCCLCAQLGKAVPAVGSVILAVTASLHPSAHLLRCQLCGDICFALLSCV